MRHYNCLEVYEIGAFPEKAVAWKVYKIYQFLFVLSKIDFD